MTVIDPGFEIDPAAPRAQGMSDETAALVVAKSEEHRAACFHVRADVTGRTALLTVSNCPAGQILFGFGDGSAEVAVDQVGAGPSATAEHTYLSDGVFLAQALIATDRATVEVAVNWPPHEATEPPA